MNKIHNFKEKLAAIETQLSSLQNLKEEVNALYRIVTFMLTDLTEQDYIELADLLIAGIEVHADYVVIHYYFNDFFEEGDGRKNVPVK